MTPMPLAPRAPDAVTVLRALREAVVTMLAAIATVLCALAIDPEPGPAVLAVVLCISLSRSQLDRDRRGRIEAALMLPLVGVATVGVAAIGSLDRSHHFYFGYVHIDLATQVWPDGESYRFTRRVALCHVAHHALHAVDACHPDPESIDAYHRGIDGSIFGGCIACAGASRPFSGRC
jgi:hypothetical protein